jgi:hypothetical protein
MGKIRSIAAVRDVLEDQLDAALRNPGEIFGYARYGDGEQWAQLDHLTGGLQRNSYTVLAAFPKVGKSMFAATIIPFVAEQAVAEDKVVRVCTLETTEEVYTRRMAAVMSGIRDPKNIKRGTITPEEEKRYRSALKYLNSLPIEFLSFGRDMEFEETMIPGGSGVTVDDVRDFVHGTGDTFLWVVDHLGLLRNTEQSRDTYTNIVSLNDKLTDLAHNVGTGIVVTHLTRASRGSRPTLGSLAGADQIGRNLDVGLIIDRPIMDMELTGEQVEMYREGEPASLYFYSRDEGMGVVPMWWQHEYACFKELVLAPGVEVPMPKSKKKAK